MRAVGDDWQPEAAQNSELVRPSRRYRTKCTFRMLDQYLERTRQFQPTGPRLIATAMTCPASELEAMIKENTRKSL